MDTPNSQKYLPPEGYYDRTAGRTSDLLVLAMGYLDEGARYALDLGCGAGGDTSMLASYGFSVTAVDGNPEAKAYIDKLPDRDLITFIQSDIEEFSFGQYDLVNASFALPFVHPDVFGNVMKKLVASIESNGIFVANFYGPNDGWNKPGETMTFIDEAQIQNLLKDMSILHLVENELDGTIADGAPKHWHTYDVIARKP